MNAKDWASTLHRAVHGALGNLDEVQGTERAADFHFTDADGTRLCVSVSVVPPDKPTWSKP